MSEHSTTAATWDNFGQTKSIEVHLARFFSRGGPQSLLLVDNDFFHYQIYSPNIYILQKPYMDIKSLLTVVLHYSVR